MIAQSSILCGMRVNNYVAMFFFITFYFLFSSPCTSKIKFIKGTGRSGISSISCVRVEVLLLDDPYRFLGHGQQCEEIMEAVAISLQVKDHCARNDTCPATSRPVK